MYVTIMLHDMNSLKTPLQEELNGVRNNLERVPLTLLGELCAGQLVELASDAELEVADSRVTANPGGMSLEFQGVDSVGFLILRGRIPYRCG